MEWCIVWCMDMELIINLLVNVNFKCGIVVRWFYIGIMGW